MEGVETIFVNCWTGYDNEAIKFNIKEKESTISRTTMSTKLA